MFTAAWLLICMKRPGWPINTVKGCQPPALIRNLISTQWHRIDQQASCWVLNNWLWLVVACTHRVVILHCWVCEGKVLIWYCMIDSQWESLLSVFPSMASMCLQYEGVLLCMWLLWDIFHSLCRCWALAVSLCGFYNLCTADVFDVDIWLSRSASSVVKGLAKDFAVPTPDALHQWFPLFPLHIVCVISLLWESGIAVLY